MFCSLENIDDICDYFCCKIAKRNVFGNINVKNLIYQIHKLSYNVQLSASLRER